MPVGGVEKAIAFYGGTLGLERKPTPPALDGDRIVWFKLGDDIHELHMFTEEDDVRSAGQHFCMQVDDLDAFRDRLTSNGVDVAETETIVSRPRFMIRDPFGNRIEVAQITGENYTDDPSDAGR
jgi:catechol 2,3-dioxygenase-like lactoylglutathione lyase family enzyme